MSNNELRTPVNRSELIMSLSNDRLHAIARSLRDLKLFLSLHSTTQ